MKNKKRNYQALKQQLLKKVAAVVGINIIVYSTIIIIARGRFGDFIVNWLINRLYMDENSAFNFYHILIRNNVNIFTILFACLTILIILKVIFREIDHYFNQIETSLNLLTQIDTQPISLPDELEPLSLEMNQVKQELVARRQDAKIAEQRKNDLVMYLAHDIRTPLTVVIGYLNLLTETPHLPEEQRQKYLAITLEKTYHLESLINEFFEITRFNLQEVVIETIPLDLKLLCEQIGDEFYSIAQKKKQTIEVKGKSVRIEADPSKMGRAISNLVKNALAYGFEESTILITVEAANEKEATVTIQNDGPNIPKEFQDKIFDKFYRMDEARSTQTGGSGLGLVITKKIIESHQGKISLTSYNNQTTFTIFLPTIHTN